MAIRAYVWKGDGDNVGHASLELSDGTYISWWPKETIQGKSQAMKNVAPCITRTFSEDVRDEGRQPKTFVLPDELGLNESKIKEWWKTMKKDGTYSLLGNNCCAAVKQALAAGGITTERQFLVETPTGMIEYLEYLVDTKRYQGPRTKKTH